jgi:hypothetical protein
MWNWDNSSHWELLGRIVNVVVKNVDGCIVEVGGGKSSFVLYGVAKRNNVRYLSCDISPIQCRNVKSLGTEVEVFMGSSIEFMKNFPKNVPISVVFLDGEHTYSTVIKEIDFFLPKLSSGGLIMMHDTLPKLHSDLEAGGAYTGDVYLARQEMEKRSDVQVFTWPYTALGYGLTMIMKKEEDPPFYREMFHGRV